MRIIFILGLISILSGFPLLADGGFQKGLDYASQADKLFQKSQFEDAVRALAKAEEAWPDTGYYATRIAGAYLQKNDLSTALQHLDRAVKQGGERTTYTMRERGIVLCRLTRYSEAEAAFESAAKISRDNKEDIEETLHVLGYAAQCKNSQELYSQALEITTRGFALKPNTTNYQLNQEKISAETILAHLAMSEGRFQEAATRYNSVEKVAMKSPHHRGWLERIDPAMHSKLAEIRYSIQKKNIMPEYIHRIQVFFIMKSDFDFTTGSGERIVAKDEITEEQIKNSKLYLNILKGQIEAMTDGRLSLDIQYKVIDASFTEIDKSMSGNLEVRLPVLNSLPDSATASFCEAVGQADTFWIFWAGKDVATTANGGAAYYPCIPYQLSTAMRGYVAFPAGWTSLDVSQTFIHEFFHVIEAMNSVAPSHGFTAENRGHFPGWKGSGQLSFFHWYFQNKLPGNNPIRNSYTNQNFLSKHPNNLTDEIIDQNRSMVRSLKLSDRKEAQTFASQASNYYWNIHNLKSALESAQKSLALNPYQKEGLMIASMATLDLQRYKESALYLERLLPLHPDGWLVERLASLRQWNLNDIPGAIEVYEVLLSRFPNYEECYPAYGRALMEAGRYDEALDAFDKGRLSKLKTRNPSTAADSSFHKGLLLGEKLNNTKEALFLVQEAIRSGYNKDEYVEYFLNKYSAVRVSSRSMIEPPTAPISIISPQSPDKIEIKH